MLKAIALAALIQVPAPSQELAPGTRYDSSIPTLEQVAGHGLREEITPPDQVIAYLDQLDLHAGLAGWLALQDTSIAPGCPPGVSR